MFFHDIINQSWPHTPQPVICVHLQMNDRNYSSQGNIGIEFFDIIIDA